MSKYFFTSLFVLAAVAGSAYLVFARGPVDPNKNQASVQASQNIAGETGGTSATTNPETGTTDTPKNTNITKKHMITITTNYGDITFETYDNDAPNTVQNFVTLANKGFYNGLTFHRVIKGFMIQGGDPNGNGTGGPGYAFADEINPASDLYKTGYKKGVVAMANAGPNTNGSQFFIMTEDYPLPPNYTIFGKVTAGQDVVDKIAGVKTGAGDKPVTPVTMKSVSVKETN